jgi:hypothetical protein
VQRIEGPARTSETALFLNGDGGELITAGLEGVIAYDTESGQPLSNESHPSAGAATPPMPNRLGRSCAPKGPG